MTSPVDIGNLALAEIGARATITSWDEVSVEASVLRMFYDRTRKQLLRAAHWGFARKSLTLTQLGTLSDVPPGAPYPWQYKYAYPSDCLLLQYILPTPVNVSNSVAPPVGDLSWGSSTWQMPSRANRFIVANDDAFGKVILSNVYQAIGVYTEDVQNPELFDALFEDALIMALAYRAVIPLSGNVGMKQQYGQLAEMALMKARASEESIATTDHTPDWIIGRGDMSLTGAMVDQPNMGQWYGSWDTMAWGS